MSKSTTPAQAGTEKTKKTRAAKQLTAADIVSQFTRLPLAEKLEVQKKIGACIEDDRGKLKQQLALIEGNARPPMPTGEDDLSIC